MHGVHYCIIFIAKVKAIACAGLLDNKLLLFVIIAGNNKHVVVGSALFKVRIF